MSLEEEFEEYSKNNCKNCKLNCTGITKSLNGVRCYEKETKDKS
jgi:hypothetical protein